MKVRRAGLTGLPPVEDAVAAQAARVGEAFDDDFQARLPHCFAGVLR